MSCIVPSSDGISRHPEVTGGREVKSGGARSAYVQRFALESKPTFPNTTNWNRIVQNFLSTSTLHGVSHLRPPCSRPQKCFWLFAMLACGTFLLVHATVLIYNALTRPSLSTTLTLKYRDLDGPLLNDYDKITKFPGITICGLTPFKSKDTEDSLSLTMYHSLSLGYPYSGLTLEQRINLHEAITKPDDVLDNMNTSIHIFREKLKEFTKNIVQRINISDILWENSYRCEDVFSRCSVGFEPLNCCSVFVPILTTYGYCFALQDNKTTLGNLEMETLPFIIDLHVPISNATDSEEGYVLLVHDPRFSPRMILPKDGFLVAPGVTMSLRLTLRITDYSAKYSKWFGLVTDCPKVACMGEDYSIQECIFQNAASKIKDVCHCAWILDECKNGSKEMPICGPKEMTECVIIKATQILSDLLRMCQPPCLEYIFEAASSYAQFRYNHSLQERSRISISYNTISYYHNIYHKHYLSSLFSDIGGAMGLLLGASCLTGVELLTFLGQWIYYTFLDKI